VTTRGAGDEAERVGFVVILGVEQGRFAQLRNVADTRNLARLLTRGAKHGKEYSRHDHDNGDNHQKLDERKTVLPMRPTSHDSPSLRSLDSLFLSVQQ
jgi:hypothetical protein